MITKLLMGFLNMVTKIVSLILLPLDLLASQLLPDISSTISNIVYYLNLPAQFMGWIFQLVHVPSFALELIVAYWIFKYGIIGATAGAKTVITLYQRFKP